MWGRGTATQAARMGYCRARRSRREEPSMRVATAARLAARLAAGLAAALLAG